MSILAVFPIFSIVFAIIFTVVALSGHIYFIQNNTKDRTVTLFQLLLYVLCKPITDHTGFDDDNRTITFFRDNRAVDNASQRRGIDQYVIIYFLRESNIALK